MSEKQPEKIDPEIVRQAEKRLSTAKAKLLLKNPFYGVLLSMTNFIREDVIPTMATNGVNVYFNPKYVMELSDQEVNGVLLHEISHCIYMHCNPKRRMNREQHKWNVATDFAINIEIKGMNKSDYQLPKQALLQDKYRNHNAEMIYDKLPQDASQYQTLDIHIEPADGTEDWDDMEDKIISVYEMTKDSYDKTAGNMPANIRAWIDKMRKSKVKWERIFHRYVGQALAKDDYSYIRPNRRYVSQDLYIPDLRNTTLGRVCVCIDTSGSISQKQLEIFAAELMKINYLIEECLVITCDIDVHEYKWVRKLEGDLFKKIKFLGRGGTSFRKPFEMVAERKEQLDLFIYFTDGYGDWPEKAPQHFPVIALLTEDNSPKCPWPGSANIYIPNDKIKGNDY